MRALLILLALLAFPTAATARLSPEERRMAAAVTAEQERTVALLERLVNRNSGSLNLAGVRAIGQMMREELEPLGFTVRWVDNRGESRTDEATVS